MHQHVPDQSERADSRQHKQLGYLSGAPRVSTDPAAVASGPRSHVLGVIRAFQALNWDVHPFIVGDQMPPSVRSKGAQQAISGGMLRTLMVDIIRLALGQINARRAWRNLGGRVDMVYERFAVLQAMGYRFSRAGTPWILETSGPFFYEAKSERNSLVLTGVARWLELNAYRNCDLLVCVSEALKEIVVQQAGVDEEKILVLPNGVDTDFFDPATVAEHRQFDGFVVGYVGSVLAWQSLDLLVAATHVLRQQGLDIYLVIVGDGPAMDELKNLVRKLAMVHVVHFAGQVSRDDVPSYIAGFDVGYSGQRMLSIGKMYHSPLKIYEYMSMGKPVVASAFEDAVQVTQQGALGFLFQSGDQLDLQRVLADAYENRHRSVSRQTEIRSQIVASHSWTSRVTRLLTCLEERSII